MAKTLSVLRCFSLLSLFLRPMDCIALFPESISRMNASSPLDRPESSGAPVLGTTAGA